MSETLGFVRISKRGARSHQNVRGFLRSLLQWSYDAELRLVLGEA